MPTMTKGKSAWSVIEELREIRDKVGRLTRTYYEDILMAVLADGEKLTIAEIQTRLKRTGLPPLKADELRRRLKALVDEERLVSVTTEQRGLPKAYGLPRGR